jgi:hypothetical protein
LCTLRSVFSPVLSTSLYLYSIMGKAKI